MKVLVFDMDGTIADLYGVKDWLPMLRAENVRPYVVAEPIYDMTVINNLLLLLKAEGWRIVITSWLSKGSSKEYDKQVRRAKINWLDEVGFPYDEIHLIKYGTTKASCTRKLGGFQILVDDNEQVRKGWNLGDTIDPTEDLVVSLLELLSE
jgi:hypothetical protein